MFSDSSQRIFRTQDHAWGVRPRKAASRSLGPAVRCHDDRRREQGVSAGVGNQQWGHRQEVGGEGVRDRLAMPARPGHVPPVDGDLEGARTRHDARRQRAAGDVDDLVLVARAGPCGQEPAGTIAEGPDGVHGQVTVINRGVQANASGVDALVECGQGLVGVPEQHPQVPSPAGRRARQELRRDGPDRGERVADRWFQQPGPVGRPGCRACRGHRRGAGAAVGAAGRACGRPNIATRPGSLNETTRVTRDMAVVSTCIPCAWCTPS